MTQMTLPDGVLQGMKDEFQAARIQAHKKQIAALQEEVVSLKQQLAEAHRLYQSSAQRRSNYHQTLLQIGRIIREME